MVCRCGALASLPWVERLPYRLVIFDFDGTLHDSMPWFLGVMNVVTARHGLRTVALEEVETFRGMNARQVIERLGVPLWKVPLIARDTQRLKSEQIDQIPLFPGAADMLRAIAAQGTLIAVVSSDTEANVRAALAPEMTALVAHFACGVSLFGKSQLFRAVLRQAGVAAAEAIAVGDELRDLEAARKAGIPFAGVSWGYTRREALAAGAPDVLFDSIAELAAHLTSGA